MEVRLLRPPVHMYCTAQYILYSGTALKSFSAESPSPCPLFPHPPSLPWTNELYRHRTLYVGIVFNRFYRLVIHSPIVVIVDPACELLLPWTKEIYTCVLLPLSSTFSLTYPPPPSQTKCTIYTDSEVCGFEGGRGVAELCCRPYSPRVLHSVSDQI